MRSVRYAGRNTGGEAGVINDPVLLDDPVLFDDTDLFDDTVPATTIAAEIESAEVVFIDDPLSFPWEFMTSAPTAALVVDVGQCTSDQLVALAPALTHLTEFDTVIDRAQSNDRANRFAHLLGARSVAPSTSQLVELREQKQLHCVEADIIGRLRQDWQTLVVDVADLPETPWASTRWSDPLDQRPAALVVRLPGEVIRRRGGLTAMADELVATVAGTAVLDVWGVRAHPGDPLSRGLVVIGVDR